MKSLILLFLVSGILFGNIFAQTNKLDFRILFHKNEYAGYSLSPNGQNLIIFSPSEGVIRSLNVDTEKVLWATSVPESETSEFPEFAWSNDGAFVAMGDQSGSCRLFDATSGKLLWYTTNPKFDIESMKVGFGKLIAVIFSEEQGRKLQIYDLGSGSLKHSVNLGEYPIMGLGFADKETHLRYGDSSGKVTALNITRPQLSSSFLLRPCGNEKTYSRSVGFSPDMKVLVGRCGSKSIITSTLTKKVIHVVPMDADFEDGVSFSGDGKFVGLENLGGYKLLDLRTGAVKKISDTPLGEIDGSGKRSISSTDYKDRGLQIAEVQTGRVIKNIESHPGEIKDLAFSPDGKFFASASADGFVRVWSTTSKTVVWSILQFDRGGKVVSFSPDGRTLLATGDREDDKHELLLFDSATGNLIRRVPTENDGNDGILRAVFSPDGSLLLTSGNSVSFKLWDIKSWTVRGIFKTNESHTNGNTGYCCGSVAKSIAFSESGTKILSAHEDGTVKIWDINDPEPVKIFKVSDGPISATYSPDESKIVAISSGTHPSILIDANTGSVLQTFQTGLSNKELDYVTGAVFSPSGNSIYTTSWFDDVIEWNSDTGKLLNRLDVGYSTEDVLRISPDGSYLLSGGENQNILLFDTHDSKLLWSLFPINRNLERIKDEKENERIASVDAEKEAKRLADLKLEPFVKLVYVTFSHYGDMTDPGQKKLLEKDDPIESKTRLPKAFANAVWLRLHNASQLPIEFPTQSMYLPNKKCFFKFDDGMSINGLCEGREVNVWHGLEDRNGKAIPYGFDFGSSAILLPGTSVLFPVPISVFEEGDSVVFDYTFQNVGFNKKIGDYGNEKKLIFKATDLPN